MYEIARDNGQENNPENKKMTVLRPVMSKTESIGLWM